MAFLEHSFYHQLKQISTEELLEKLNSIDSREVEDALYKKGSRSVEDFMALISNRAEPYLEEMALISHQQTIHRFGRVITLYIPIYISNACTNICTYCGYSLTNSFPRITLSLSQVQREMETVRAMGFDHVVLLTGESPKEVNVEYFKDVLKLAKKIFSFVAIEVQPLKQEDYKVLKENGLGGVYVYQETYGEESYKKVHLKGSKSNYRYRLETPERAAAEGIRKIGLGVLLGLGDSEQVDSLYLAYHYEYLKKKYWKTKYSISFPRIKKADDIELSFHSIADRRLVQLICAWRIYDPDVDLSLSTREEERFRDAVFPLGISTMSACSKTSPGAYGCDLGLELEQFEISDNRNLSEIKQAIKMKNYEVVMKDWDKSF